MTYNSSFTGAQVDSVVDAGLPGGSTLYGVSNLLGTVSQSGGVPTGAVIERDSSATGEWVLFADGTAIAMTEYTESGVDIDDAIGSGFRSDFLTIPLPLSFVGDYSATHHAGSDSANGIYAWVGGRFNDPSNRVQLHRWTSVTGIEISIKSIWFGRWF